MISIFPRHQNIQCHYSGSVDQYQLEEPIKLFKQTGLLVSWNAYPLDNISPVVQTDPSDQAVAPTFLPCQGRTDAASSG